MDAFYASIEQRDDPSLRGRPVAVGRRAVRARRRRGGQLRGAHVRRALRHVERGARPAVPRPRARPSRLREVPGGVAARSSRSSASVTPLVEPLSLDEAYLDVTENAWGEPLGMTVARRIKDRDPRGDGPDRLGGRRAEQVPREDRVGLEEAGRPDGGRARAGGVVPARSAGRCALGRRAGHREAPARDRRHEDGATSGAIDRAALEQAVGSAGGLARRSSRTGIDDRPVEPERPAKSSGTESTYAQDLVDIGADSGRDRGRWRARPPSGSSGTSCSRGR